MNGNNLINFYQGAERNANLRALQIQLERALQEAKVAAAELSNLSVTVKSIAEGMTPTVSVTRDENGIHMELGIPDGKTGNKGDRGDEGYSPVIELEETENGVTVTVTNKDGKQSVQIPAAKFETDETLTLKGGILSVNRAEKVEEDNTLPVTSAAVFAEVGNINALLATI